MDFILGKHEVAIEVKGTNEVQTHHLKGILAFQEEYKPKKSLAVSLDRHRRQFHDIEIFPVQDFLKALVGNPIL